MKNTPTALLVSLTAAASWSLMAAEPDLSKLPPPSTQKNVTYEKDIKPLFEASCFRCHGADRQRGGLRLDSLEAIHKGGDDGKILTVGKSKESLVVIAVAQIDDENAMPPKRGAGGRGGPGGRGGQGGFGPGGMLATQMVAQGDKNGDKALSKDEFTVLADTWFDKLDADKAGKLNQEQFVAKFGDLLPAPQGRQGGGGQPPGGGQGPGGGRGGFNPGRFIGPGFFTAIDTDKDGSVTRAEMKATFARWYGDWDSAKSGSLTEDKIREGLNTALPRPNFGGQGGPGGPGGPGGAQGQNARGGPGGPGGPGGQGGPGGPPATPLTTEQVGLVRAWIDQGAK